MVQWLNQGRKALPKSFPSFSTCFCVSIASPSPDALLNSCLKMKVHKNSTPDFIIGFFFENRNYMKFMYMSLILLIGKLRSLILLDNSYEIRDLEQFLHFFLTPKGMTAPHSRLHKGMDEWMSMKLVWHKIVIKINPVILFCLIVKMYLSIIYVVFGPQNISAASIICSTCKIPSLSTAWFLTVTRFELSHRKKGKHVTFLIKVCLISFK